MILIQKLDQHDANIQIDEALVSPLLAPATIDQTTSNSDVTNTEQQELSDSTVEAAAKLQALELQQKLFLQRKRLASKLAPPNSFTSSEPTASTATSSQDSTSELLASLTVPSTANSVRTYDCNPRDH